jgi:hypothetical protein
MAMERKSPIIESKNGTVSSMQRAGEAPGRIYQV